jgi:hypothetical protein
MSTAVVCISRTLGAGGEDVGRLVAEQLGFRYADDEIIDAAAERAGVSRTAVASAERPPGLMARILESLAATPMVAESGAWTGMPGFATATPAAAGYEELIQDVIRESAAQGKVVIVAHGGSVCLRGAPSVLRVLVTAPAELRAARLTENGGVDAAKAQKAVSDSDRMRREYLQRFYHAKEEPTDYDLVVNTEVLGIENAAHVVVDAARH